MRTGKEPTDVRAVKHGTSEERQGFLDALARRYRIALNRFFERRAPSFSQDSEDLTQEVFARLARRDGDRAIEDVEPYIFQTARSVLTDFARRRTVRHAGSHETYDDASHAVEDFATDRVLIGREQVEVVIRTLEDLPERVRAAFVLHRFEELTYREIGQRLGVSVSSVEKYIIKALKELSANAEDRP